MSAISYRRQHKTIWPVRQHLPRPCQKPLAGGTPLQTSQYQHATLTSYLVRHPLMQQLPWCLRDLQQRPAVSALCQSQAASTPTKLDAGTSPGQQMALPRHHHNRHRRVWLRSSHPSVPLWFCLDQHVIRVPHKLVRMEQHPCGAQALLPVHLIR